MRNWKSLPVFLALAFLAACGQQDSGVGAEQPEQADPFGQQQTPQEPVQQPNQQQPTQQPDQGGLQNPPQGQ